MSAPDWPCSASELDAFLETVGKIVDRLETLQSAWMAPPANYRCADVSRVDSLAHRVYELERDVTRVGDRLQDLFDRLPTILWRLSEGSLADALEALGPASVCLHNRQRAECDECDRLSDLAYDAAREDAAR